MQALSRCAWRGALEENLLACLRASLGGQQGREVFEEGSGWSAYRSGLAFPAYNGIVYCQDGFCEDSRLLKRVADFQAEGLPFVVSAASSYDLPVLWCRRLGLVSAGSVAAMVREVREMPLVDHPVELEIVRVGDEEVLGDWVRVQCRGFGFPSWLEESTKRLLSGVYERQGVSLYLGRWRGISVATSMGVRSGDLMGIYNVATLPVARCRGIGQAMTACVLGEAYKQGASKVVLQSSAAGESLYRRMGFLTVGGFEHYVWASWRQWVGLVFHGAFHQIASAWQQRFGRLPA
ncbi:GNAT family N-acetyltransferase [Myxococcota bacterium]|nr:GNAT family N-acetyltransferase [Myxococcota bacterium]